MENSQSVAYEKYFEDFYKLVEEYGKAVINHGDVVTILGNLVNYLTDMYTQVFLDEVSIILEELDYEISIQDIANIQNRVNTTSFVRSNRGRLRDILTTKEQDIQEIAEKHLDEVGYDGVFSMIISDLQRFATSEIHMAIEKASVEGSKLLQEVTGIKLFKTWNCVGDSHTCKTCLAMNGVTIPVEESFINAGLNASIVEELSYTGGDITYAHPRCRCWVTYTQA